MAAGRPSNRRTLDIWMNGERVGQWQASDRHMHVLVYDESWLASSSCRPLSMSLPVTHLTHRGDVVRAYFDNLLPENDRIRERLRAHYGARSTVAFDLLSELGRDCVGAVQLLPEGSPAPNVRTIESVLLTEAATVKAIENAIDPKPFGADAADDLRISIAGAQEKTALLRHRGRWHRPLGATPTTHLLKLPLGFVGARRVDLTNSVENEWLCSRLFRAFGLPAPECTIEQIGPYKLLVVERFDRRLVDEAWWARLPQEDFCQATGTPPERKYENAGGPGIDAILSLLRASERATEDREMFLRAQLLFWMLAAPDGHAKNFSVFLGPQGRFVSTPFYDVVSAWPVIGRKSNQFSLQKVKLAMAVRGENSHYRLADIRRHHINMTARRCGLGRDFESSIQGVLDSTDRAIEVVNAELPSRFPADVSDAIFAGLRESAKRLAKMPA